MGQPNPPRGRRFALVALAGVCAALAGEGLLSLSRSQRARAAGFPAARYVWITDEPQHAPVRFTAVRDFTLANAPRTAVARIFVDRRFELSVNGRPAGAGGQRPGEPPAQLDVAALLRSGENSIVLAAESPDGVGAILFALTDGEGRPLAVSDGRWRVAPRMAPVRVLGRPPLYPWGLPRSR